MLLCLRLCFHIRHILRGTIPGWVQDQSLIVLGLREDSGPSIEQRRSGADSIVDRLEKSVSQALVESRIPLTVILFFARSKFCTSPSIVSLTLRTPASSCLSAASRAVSFSWDGREVFCFPLPADWSVLGR